MTTPKPSIGRIVHYVSYGTPAGEYKSTCRAAIIAAIPDRTGYADGGDEICSLVVLNPTGLFFNDCPHVEPALVHDAVGRGVDWTGGTWHWPERVQ